MKNKFQTIQPWISFILDTIKKEIRMDHLASSPAFARTHFGNRPLNRLTAEEIFAVYEKELLAGNQDLAEWVVNRWVFKHGDIYKHFAEKLSRIHPDFSAIESLDLIQSEQVLEGAPESFGFLPVYLFSFLNGVVFPEEIFTRLHHAATREESQKKIEKKEEGERQSLAEAIARQQRELFSMQQKYENKVAGLMKKYTVDVEALKKQVRSLQHQLHAVKASV
jgi:hypothetical protein